MAGEPFTTPPGIRCDGGCGEILGHHYVSLRLRVLCPGCAKRDAEAILADPAANDRDKSRAEEVRMICGLWARLPTLVALALALALSACGGEAPAWNGDPAACTFEEAGTCYVVERAWPSTTPAVVAEARRRVERLFGKDVLAGYLVTFAATAGDAACTIACAKPWEKSIRIWVPTESHVSVLIHEAAHADDALGLGHTDPRWLDVQEEVERFGEWIVAQPAEED